MKNLQFTMDPALDITGPEEIPPEDILPSVKFPANCDWARPSILAVMWAFYRSPYFMINLHCYSGRSPSGTIEVKFDLVAVNRGMKHRTCTMAVEVSPKHLCMTISSSEVVFNARKRWMHGYSHRPKWKEFGTWACKSLLLRQVHEEVFEVMES